MAEIRKESSTIESMRSAKNITTPFIPLNYNYGQNFEGVHSGLGVKAPEGSEHTKRPQKDR